MADYDMFSLNWKFLRRHHPNNFDEIAKKILEFFK